MTAVKKLVRYVYNVGLSSWGERKYQKLDANTGVHNLKTSSKNGVWLNISFNTEENKN